MKYNATIYYDEIREKVMDFEFDIDVPDGLSYEQTRDMIYDRIEVEAKIKFNEFMEQDEELRYVLDDMTYEMVE